jgi:hypothetical protein
VRESYLQARSVKAQWEGVCVCVQLVAQGLGAGPVAVSPEEARDVAAASICHCKHNRTYFTVSIPSITIQLLQFEPTKTHSVLLQSQYYSTPAAAWSMVREHAVLQNSCLKFSACLTFIGPCTVMYSYSKTNQMHQFLELFIFA